MPHPDPSPNPGPPDPGVGELFRCFFSISISAFGGALFWARRVIVEQRGWLTPDEFTEMLALCQLLPGPNVLNMAITIGARHRGARGALAGALGLMGVPVLIVLMLGALYARYGELPAVRGGLSGVAAAAAGLVVAMTAKMAVPLLRRRPWTAGPVMLIGFCGIAVLGLPLPWVLLALAPPTIALAWVLRW